ncbi:hypothetical protein D3C76_1734430 [compost metagenome]
MSLQSLERLISINSQFVLMNSVHLDRLGPEHLNLLVLIKVDYPHLLSQALFESL